MKPYDSLGWMDPKGQCERVRKLKSPYTGRFSAPGTPMENLRSPGESGGKRQILDHHPVRNLYPTGQWKAGQYVVDKQAFTLDREFKGKRPACGLVFLMKS